MQLPIVSVVIPCFNDGPYLREAVSSVLSSTYKAVEIVVVNDGSTDSKTLEELRAIELDGCFVVHQENAGQSRARNFGISVATGPYILPLDADNKIRPHFLETAVNILESNPAVGVVYGRCDYFGESTAKNVGHSFDAQLLHFRNYIDTLAVFRKSAWEGVGGFDANLRGNEDWDFWLNLYHNGIVFHFIDEVVFDYRVKATSVSSTLYQKQNYEKFSEYFFRKHGLSFREAFCEAYGELSFAKSNPVRFLVRQKFPKIYMFFKDRYTSTRRNGDD